MYYLCGIILNIKAMLMDFEFWIGILAVIGFVWCLTAFGTLIVYLINKFNT